MQYSCVMFAFDFMNIEKTTFCVIRFFSYSFTASDGSEESAAGRVVLPYTIMVLHGFRSNRQGMQESKNIDYAKQHHTPHCWLPAKVMYPANSTKRFSRLTRSTSNLLMMNVQIYVYVNMLHFLRRPLCEALSNCNHNCIQRMMYYCLS